MRASPFAEPSRIEILHALLWGACLLLHGFAAWRLLEKRANRLPPWSVCFALGCAAAVPVLALASAAGSLPATGWVLIAATPVSVLAAIRARGVPLLVPARVSPPAVVAWIPTVLAIVAMAPVAIRPQMSYDALSYHLPVTTHLRESFGYIAGNYYSRLPSAAFLLYAGAGVGGQDGGIEAPGLKVMLLLSAVAGACLCGRIAGQLGCRRSWRPFAGALYVWHPMVWGCVLNSNSDLLTAMFALGAAERALSGIRTRKAPTLVAAGFLAATAVGVKFSAVGIVAVPLVAGLLAALAGKGAGVRRIALPALFVLAGAFAGYAPWAVRSAVFGGHPLHPFAGDAPGWSTEQNDFLISQHLPRSPLAHSYWTSAASSLGVFDYTLTISPSDEATGRKGIHVSLLLLLVVAGAVRFRHPGTRMLLVMIAGGYAAWLTVGLAPGRFMLPTIALAIPLAIASIAKAPPKGLRIAGGGVLGLAAAFTLWGQWSANVYVLPRIAEAWERSGTMPQEIHQAAWKDHEETRLLLFFEARGRWFPEDSLGHTVWDVPPWGKELRRSASADEFAGRLRAAGYTHVFANEYEWGRLLNFYGGMERPPAFGEVGIGAPLPDVMVWLRAFPPYRLAELPEENLRVLAEFLVLARAGASDVDRRGNLAELWLSPIPATPPAQEDP